MTDFDRGFIVGLQNNIVVHREVKTTYYRNGILTPMGLVCDVVDADVHGRIYMSCVITEGEEDEE